MMSEVSELTRNETRDVPEAAALAQAAERPIRFLFRGNVVEVRGEPTTRTLLDWLRVSAARRGTKEGCAEGDCGACTVLVAELRTPGGEGTEPKLVVNTVNACIKFLPTLDGCAVLTVEDLQELAAADTGRPDSLHPVQQALVDCHGSQCGFCTPGFVMSLAATYEKHMDEGTRPSRGQLSDDVAGNLCRCTGYRPIIDAGERMFDLPELRIDFAAIKASLERLRRTDTFHYAADGASFFAPRTTESLAALREAKPQARLIAGTTDVALWVNKQFRDLGDMIFTGQVEALKRLHEVDGMLEIGAGVLLEDAWSAIAARYPEVRDVWVRFASPPIRRAGTLGGNIANGSPIGDGPPVMIALAAEIVLRKGARARTMPLEAFYLDYMKNAMESGEFVEAIRVPLPQPSHVFRTYKVSKRYDSDISAVLAALRLERDERGIVTEARFAFGGMAATPKRAAGTERAVVGREWDEDALEAAKEAIGQDFTPMTDQRGSADYRRAVVVGLLTRFWLETRGGPYTPLQTAQTSVFASLEHR